MRAKTQIGMSFVGVGVLIVINISVLLQHLSRTDWSFHALPILLGIFVSLCFLLLFIFGLTRKDVKTARIAYCTWLVFAIIMCAFLLIGGWIWTKSIKAVLLQLLLVALFAGIPIWIVSLILRTGIRGLERTSDLDSQQKDQ